MIALAIVGVSCMAFGLYAGKRRAEGLGWARIVSDLSSDFWRILTDPFKKGKLRSPCAEK